jgi:hypothetical protein
MTQSGFMFNGPVSMASEPIQKKAKPAAHPLLKADKETLRAAIAEYAATADECSIDDVVVGLGLPVTAPPSIRSAVLQVFSDPVNGLFKAKLHNGKLRFLRKDVSSYGAE